MGNNTASGRRIHGFYITRICQTFSKPKQLFEFCEQVFKNAFLLHFLKLSRNISIFCEFTTLSVLRLQTVIQCSSIILKTCSTKFGKKLFKCLEKVWHNTGDFANLETASA